jgi:serine O-acetyltransferase
MASKDWMKTLLPELGESIGHCLRCPAGLSMGEGLTLAGQGAVQRVVDDFVSVLFPGCHGHQTVEPAHLGSHLETRLQSIATELMAQAQRAFRYQCRVAHVRDCKECRDCEQKASDAVEHTLRLLPEIQRVLEIDIQTAYEGDPAAQSTMEVVMSYPGVYAIMVHRLAHVLYEERVPLIPRIMSEYAHSKTGIDIHPGARIGEGFFIDHGTGVVIGETCEIGKRVKLYQGVTLGALSFEKDAEGRLVKGIKRHPDVGDHVVIYAGATILGGKTKIGAHSEIGGNVWLTLSVPPYSKVYNQQPKPLIRQSDGRWARSPGFDDLGEGI